jgi:hypothetical protein
MAHVHHIRVVLTQRCGTVLVLWTRSPAQANPSEGSPTLSLAFVHRMPPALLRIGVHPAGHIDGWWMHHRASHRIASHRRGVLVLYSALVYRVQ